jgi:DNA-binding MarR family transcriptional regulator
MVMRTRHRPPEVEVWVLLFRLYNTLFRHIQAYLSRFNLTAPQYAVLRHLGERGNLKASELTVLLEVTAGNLTGILDRMEAMGLLTRQRDLQDRRNWILQLTPAGRELYEQAVPSTRAFIDELLQGLAPEELERANLLLERLLRDLGSKEAA